MSMSNGIGAYGVQNGGSTPQLRPQFRRQGSSFGHGNVHNMAVMVVPTKVDYSVTKGGVRLWAVLFVFIFLCSAMLTVFTESDDDDDDHPVSSSKFDDDDEAEADKNIKTPRIVEDEDLEDDGEAANPPDRGPSAAASNSKATSASPEIITAGDEEEEDEEPQEEELFAKLREKAAKQSARRKRKEAAARKAAEENGGEDSEVAPVKQSRRKRKQKEVEVEQEKVEEIEIELEEVQEDQNDAIVVEEAKQKRKSRRRKKVEVIKEEDDDDDDESEVVIEESHPEVEKDDNEKTSDKHEDDNKDNENNDDDDDDEEDESAHPTPPQPPRHNPIKNPKKKAASWKRNIAAEDNPAPRKNLLKHTKRKQKASPENNNENGEEDENEDDENEENENDEEALETAAEQRMQTHDIVSIRKKAPQYNRKAITNRDDYKHRNRLDTADFLLEKHEFAKASSLYDQVLSFNKESPRAHFGKARTLQLRSEFEGNEYLLDAAIAEYQIVLDDEDTPEVLFRMSADNVIECARYRGNLHKVMTVQRALLDRFPDDIELQNNFGVTFLMMGRIEDARNVFSAILESNANDPLAQAYYGYILKVHDHDFEKGVQFMRRGLRGSDEAIIDAKFYFHLGDGLMRLGRNQEALRVYEEATHLGLFPSPLQRSFHNLEGLVARPWWTLEQTGCGKHLKHVERQWTVIREEAVKLWQNYEDLFEAEDLHLTEGRLVAYPISRDSTFIEENCLRIPQTCTILKKFVNDAGCFKGDIRVSVLQTGSRIWPHCGATNYVLEAQLGLQVTSDARIRVASDVKGWKTGKFLVYDESFEHEIWFDGASANTVRIILSMELWHPEVPQLSRADTLRP